MCKAFKAAKASAHPDSKLYYNDYNIEAMVGWQQTRSDAAYNMIKNMTDRGYDDCPIDGVGFQGHLNTKYSDTMLDSIHDNFQRYAALGLKVQITEVDISCPKSNGVCEIDSWNDEELDKQGALFSNLL